MAKKKVTYKWDEFLKRLKDSIFRPKREGQYLSPQKTDQGYRIPSGIWQ